MGTIARLVSPASFYYGAGGNALFVQTLYTRMRDRIGRPGVPGVDPNAYARIQPRLLTGVRQREGHNPASFHLPRLLRRGTKRANASGRDLGASVAPLREGCRQHGAAGYGRTILAVWSGTIQRNLTR